MHHKIHKSLLYIPLIAILAGCSPSIKLTRTTEQISVGKKRGTTYERTYAQGIQDISKLEATVQEDEWIWNNTEWIDISNTEDKDSVTTDLGYVNKILEEKGTNIRYIEIHNHKTGKWPSPPSTQDYWSSLLMQVDLEKYNITSQVVDSSGVWTFQWKKMPEIYPELKRLYHRRANDKDFNKIIAYRDSLVEKMDSMFDASEGFNDEMIRSCIEETSNNVEGVKIVYNFVVQRKYKIMKEILEEIGIELKYTPLSEIIHE